MTKSIVITGAGSGVGRATAIAFLNAGWGVALLGRRADALEETVTQAANSEAALILPTDVTDEDAVTAAFDSTVAKFASSTPSSTMRAVGHRP